MSEGDGERETRRAPTRPIQGIVRPGSSQDLVPSTKGQRSARSHDASSRAGQCRAGVEDAGPALKRRRVDLDGDSFYRAAVSALRVDPSKRYRR